MSKPTSAAQLTEVFHNFHVLLNLSPSLLFGDLKWHYSTQLAALIARHRHITISTQTDRQTDTHTHRDTATDLWLVRHSRWACTAIPHLYTDKHTRTHTHTTQMTHNGECDMLIYTVGRKKADRFPTVCNSRICWHRIVLYISNCSVIYSE